MLTRTMFVAGALLAVTACESAEEKRAKEAAQQMEQAAKKMEEATKSGQVNVGDAMSALGAAMGAANGGKKVETVDFRTLRDMLPGSIAGMNRGEATGEKNAAMGMQVSTAMGRYSNDGGKSAQLTITDIGSMSGLAGMATYAWATAEFDRETATGYEKTTRIGNHKAIEKYDRSSKSGEVSVIVGDRFVVAAQGNGVDADELRDAVQKVDLGKLNGMKNQGVN